MNSKVKKTQRDSMRKLARREAMFEARQLDAVTDSVRNRRRSHSTGLRKIWALLAMAYRFKSVGIEIRTETIDRMDAALIAEQARQSKDDFRQTIDRSAEVDDAENFLQQAGELISAGNFRDEASVWSQATQMMQNMTDAAPIDRVRFAVAVANIDDPETFGDGFTDRMAMILATPRRWLALARCNWLWKSIKRKN